MTERALLNRFVIKDAIIREQLSRVSEIVQKRASKRLLNTVAKRLAKRRSRLVVTAPLERTYPRRVASSKTSSKPTSGPYGSQRFNFRIACDTPNDAIQTTGDYFARPRCATVKTSKSLAGSASENVSSISSAESTRVQSTGVDRARQMLGSLQFAFHEAS